MKSQSWKESKYHVLPSDTPHPCRTLTRSYPGGFHGSLVSPKTALELGCDVMSKRLTYEQFSEHGARWLSTKEQYSAHGFRAEEEMDANESINKNARSQALGNAVSPTVVTRTRWTASLDICGCFAGRVPHGGHVCCQRSRCQVDPVRCYRSVANENG